MKLAAFFGFLFAILSFGFWFLLIALVYMVIFAGTLAFWAAFWLLVGYCILWLCTWLGFALASIRG